MVFSMIIPLRATLISARKMMGTTALAVMTATWTTIILPVLICLL